MSARPQFGWLCECGDGGENWTARGAVEACEKHAGECDQLAWHGAMWTTA